MKGTRIFYLISAVAGVCALVGVALAGEAGLPRTEYVYAGEWGGVSAVDGEPLSPWGIAAG